MNRRYGWIVTIVLLLALIFVLALAQETTPRADDTIAENVVEFTVETAETTAGQIEDFLNRLIVTPKSDIARVLLVVGGVVLLVAGWRIYDFIVIIAGFLIGASIAVSLVTTDNTLIIIAALLMGGLLGALLGVFLYYAAVFLMGAYIGVVLTAALANSLSLIPVSGFVLFAGGLIGGLVLLGLSFEFLVLLSSLVGAQMLSLGLGLGVIWTAVFAVAGVILQAGLIRGFRYDFRRRRRGYNINMFRRGHA